jgi:hypothetical protein
MRELAVGFLQSFRDAANEEPGGGALRGFAGRQKGEGSRESDAHASPSIFLHTNMPVIAALCKPLGSPISILLLLKPP